ncbi:MAG: hypothetical protein ACI9R3_004743 [Verrucomicrobiales bacterium]|jgi:hypothetical protein
MTSTQISAIFFVVGFVAVVPVLYYHYRKNPHPRFRPPLGEMVMLSIFALMLVGGGSYFMGAVLSSDPDFDADMKKSTTNRAQQQDDQPQRSKSKKENKNSFPF